MKPIEITPLMNEVIARANYWRQLLKVDYRLTVTENVVTFEFVNSDQRDWGSFTVELLGAGKFIRSENGIRKPTKAVPDWMQKSIDKDHSKLRRFAEALVHDLRHPELTRPMCCEG